MNRITTVRCINWHNVGRMALMVVVILAGMVAMSAVTVMALGPSLVASPPR